MVRCLYACATLLSGATCASYVVPFEPSLSLRRSTTTSTRSRSSTSSSRLQMISNIFGGGDNDSLPKLPRDVKEAVSRCREVTQSALQNRVSRMNIEFPVGTKFGVEKGGKKKKKRTEGDDKLTRSALDKSDRELARIFVEMFQPVGGENLVVTFCDVAAADAAKARWKGDISAEARIMSMDRRKTSTKKKRKPTGFAAKMAAEIEDDESGPFTLPSNTEVALFVGPGPKELVVIESICDSVGMGTLVVLLNARLDLIDNLGSVEAEKLFREDFEPVFSLTAAPQDVAPGCLLHSAYGKGWVLARKPAVGQPKTILAQATRPTSDECRAAFSALELSDVEKNVETAFENVANWLR